MVYIFVRYDDSIGSFCHIGWNNILLLGRQIQSFAKKLSFS